MKCSASRSRERACERLNRTGRRLPRSAGAGGFERSMGPGRFVFLAGLKRRPAPKFVDTTWTNRSTSSRFSEGHRPDSHCAGAAPAHTHNADTDIRRELSQPSDSSSRAPIYIVGAVVWPLAVGGGNGCNVAARMQAPQAIRIGGTHASGWRAARQCTSDRTDLCRHLPRAGCRHFRNGGGRFAHIGVPDPYRDPVIPRLGDWTR